MVDPLWDYYYCEKCKKHHTRDTECPEPKETQIVEKVVYRTVEKVKQIPVMVKVLAEKKEELEKTAASEGIPLSLFIRRNLDGLMKMGIVECDAEVVDVITCEKIEQPDESKSRVKGVVEKI